MRTLKAFLITFLALISAAQAEEIYKPFEIDNVLVTIYWYDTLEELQEVTEEDSDTLGWSDCEVYPDKNIAYCHIHQVRPKEVDDDHVLSFGHEGFHGVYGPEYHESDEEESEEE